MAVQTEDGTVEVFQLADGTLPVLWLGIFLFGGTFFVALLAIGLLVLGTTDRPVERRRDY
jgi:hypothetical protein